MSQELTHADKRAAFEIATSALMRWYGDRIAAGIDDEGLAEMLGNVLGIAGGSGGPDRISVSFRGAGLRIWAGWQCPNEVTDKPIFAGDATVRMAREVYGISDPSCAQLALL